MKIKKILLFILVFIFIISLLLWSVPIWGAEKSIEERNIVNIYNPENFFLSDSNSDFNILKPRILPDSKIFFLKILGEEIKRLFLFSKIKKLNYDIKLANYRIIETRTLSLREGIDEGLKLNSSKRFQKRLNKINNRVLNLISKKSSQIADNNISDKLISSFIIWQKILSEISYLNKYHSEVSFLSQEIWKMNNSQIPLSIIKFEGIEKFVLMLEKYFFDNNFDEENNISNNSGSDISDNNRNNISDNNEDNISNNSEDNIYIINKEVELFKNLRNLEVFNGLDLDIFSNEKIWILKDKLIGKVIGEVFSAQQIYKSDFENIINSVPFLNNLTKKNIFLELKIRSGFEERFSLILDSIEMNFSNQLAEDCYSDMLLKMESNLKKLENEISNISLLSSTNKRNNLIILAEQIKGYISSSKEKKELNNIQSSCLLLKESLIFYQISGMYSFYYNNEEKILEIGRIIEEELEKEKEILQNYQEYIRVKDIFEQLKFISEIIDNFIIRKEDVLRLLGQNILFWSWQRNLELSKNIIDIKEENKFLFSKETEEKFNSWCWNERGIISESLSLFSNCLLSDNKKVSLFEWSLLGD